MKERGEGELTNVPKRTTYEEKIPYLFRERREVNYQKNLEKDFKRAILDLSLSLSPLGG